MAKDQVIKISCNACPHEITVDKAWVEGRMQVEPHASTESIVCILGNNSQRLVCTCCGLRAPKILCTFLPLVVPDQVPKKDRIFINEGIAGNREDNKNARGRQHAINRQVKI